VLKEFVWFELLASSTILPSVYIYVSCFLRKYTYGKVFIYIVALIMARIGIFYSTGCEFEYAENY
jgi:hypothetical protein